MTTVPRHIDFYFDFISHNAYLAWHVLPELAQKHTCTLRPIPVLFAGFLKAYGQLGPAEVEPKLKWMNQNVLRKATELGIRLAPPKATSISTASIVEAGLTEDDKRGTLRAYRHSVSRGLGG